MSAPIDNLIAAYVRLLVFEYQLPKARAQVAIMAKQLLLDALALQVQGAYDPTGPNAAVGKQLDVLGKYIGLPRDIGPSSALPFFGFVRYSGTGNNYNGLRSYLSSINSSGVFYRYGYKGARNTALSDSSYAFMIALQIILNSSDGTLASIQAYLAALLPGIVTVVDNKDMTLTYTITGTPPVDSTTLAAYLPKPMGVGIIVNTNDFIVTDGGDNIVTDGGDKLVTSIP